MTPYGTSLISDGSISLDSTLKDDFWIPPMSCTYVSCRALLRAFRLYSTSTKPVLWIRIRSNGHNFAGSGSLYIWTKCKYKLPMGFGCPCGSVQPSFRLFNTKNGVNMCKFRVRAGSVSATASKWKVGSVIGNKMMPIHNTTQHSN